MLVILMVSCCVYAMSLILSIQSMNSSLRLIGSTSYFNVLTLYVLAAFVSCLNKTSVVVEGVDVAAFGFVVWLLFGGCHFGRIT